MSLRQVVEAFGRTPFAEAVLRAIPGRGSVARLGGLPGSSPAVLTAWLACELPDRLLIVVAPTPADAERWISDLSQLTDLPIALYPQREALGEEEPHLEIAGQRAETLEALLHGQLRILVSTARGTAERTQVPAALDRLRLELSVGFDVPLSEITSALEGMGFRRVPTVTAVAEYAVRGGIIDLYGFGMAAPARCEWWGDRIDSLRSFDLTTQRSGDALDRITVLPIQTQAVEPQTDRPPDRRTLLELLPGDALILEERATVDEEEIERTWRDAEHHLEVARKLGEDVPSRDAIFQAPEDWKALREGFPRLLLDSPDPEIQAGFFPPERINRDLRALRLLLRSPTPTVILCDNEGQLERLMELLEDPRGETPATLVVGAVDGGFVMPTLRVLTDHEIFRRARRLRRARRYREATPSAVTGELGPGDYVVHLDHGIGIYRGLTSIDIGGGGEAPSRRPLWSTKGETGSMSPSMDWINSSRTGLRVRTVIGHPRGFTSLADPVGGGCATAPGRRSRRWLRSSSSCTLGGRSRRGSDHHQTLNGNGNSSRASYMRTRPTSDWPPTK